MKLREQRRKAAKRDEAIRNYVNMHPFALTCDELGRKFHCSRETARKALKSMGRKEQEDEGSQHQV